MIKIAGFTGILPRLNAEALPDNAAVTAENTNFNSGALLGVPQSAATSIPAVSIGVLKAGFVYADSAGSHAYSWTYDVDAVRSPVMQDAHKRFYWTGNNGGTKEFKFALVGEQTSDSGGAIDTAKAYKVGVITRYANDGTVLWDGDLADIGVTLDVRERGIPEDASAISDISFDLYVVDEYGMNESQIPVADFTFAPVGAATRGWHESYNVTLNAAIDSYAQKSSGGSTYTMEDARLATSATYGDTYAAKVWKLNGVIKYIDLNGLLQDFPTGIAVGALTSAYEVAQQDVGEGGGMSEVRTPIGQFYWRTKDVLSFDNSDLPAALTTPATVGVTNPKLAAKWTFTYNQQKYVLWMYEDASLSGTADAMGGLSGSITRASTTSFTIKPVFGFDLPVETRSYVVTFVNRLGEESEPSKAFEVTLNPGRQQVNITLNTTTFAAALDDAGMTTGRYALHGGRIYRTATDSQGNTDFLYVGTVKGSGETDVLGESYLTPTVDGGNWIIVDNVPAAQLGAACSTQDYITNANELQNLQCLTAIHNNMLAAIKDNEVWICEPGMPWAWKYKAIHTLPHKCVTVVPVEQGFYVLTDGVPYYFSGTLPEDMMGRPLPTRLPCVNKRAFAVTGGQVVYVSGDGIAQINGLDVQLNPAFSREVWRKDIDTGSLIGKMQLAVYGHRVVGYYPGNSGGYLFDIEDNSWSTITKRIDYAMQVPAGALSQTHDNLFYADGGVVWKTFATDTTATEAWVWHSKTFFLPKPTNLGCAQVFGTGTVVVKVYADGVLKHTTASLSLSTSGVIVRLPAGFMAAKWSFRIEGAASASVTAFYVAKTIAELRNG